jgi:CubicO group peptidase (beta-lactamase class C family)
MNENEKAFQLLDEVIREKMAAHQTPGLAIALTDREQIIWQGYYGYANLDTEDPVTKGTLFEIGSIGKSFTCLALLRLHELGKLDLHAPVTDYLPWLALKSYFEPVTAHHLMTHTAGLNSGIDFTPCARFEVWALREEPIAYAPGEHFSYSNVGFKLLGFLAEEVAGRPYGELLQEWILDPLEMGASEGLTTHESRKHLAVGYERFYDDRPWHRNHPLVPATWLEYGAGDGSPVCTAVDLAAYLRLFLNDGKKGEYQIFSKEIISLMTSPHVKARGHHHGYGLFLKQRNGRKQISHNGHTIGYLATMLGDMDEGIGAVILLNCPAPSDKEDIAEFGVDLIQAMRKGLKLPDRPQTVDPRHCKNAADYAGRYRGTNRTISLKAEDGRLLLAGAAGDIVLENRGEDRFYADHPDLALHLMSFQREDGRVVSFGNGAEIYVREGRNRQSETNDYPEAWKAYPGHYRAHNPWLSNFRIFLRGGILFVAYVSAQTEVEARLVELAGGAFQVGEEKTPNRLRFDTIVNGQALRATFIGGDYYRYFTP